MTAETTTTALVPFSSSGEETTTIAYPGFSIMTKTSAPETLYKAIYIDTNTYTMPSIGTAKETCLLLKPGGG